MWSTLYIYFLVYHIYTDGGLISGIKLILILLYDFAVQFFYHYQQLDVFMNHKTLKQIFHIDEEQHIAEYT